MGLDIRLLGPFGVLRDNQDITDKIRKIGKADILLRVLVCQPHHNFPSGELVDLLWGEEIEQRETKEEQAAANLRRRVSALRKLIDSPSNRKTLASSYIETVPGGYRWNSQSGYETDAATSTRHYERAQALQREEQFDKARAAYEAALALVKGECLQEDRYADWAIPLRQQWHETHVKLLTNLADCHARLGQYQHAMARCQEAIRLDGLGARNYRQLMLYNYLSGDQAEALRVYERYTRTLTEQRVSVDEQTNELYEQIKANHVPGIDKVYHPIAPTPFELPYTLSPGSIPFIGRERELAKLIHSLEEACTGHGRFVLVTGEAGVGKTRFAEEFLAHAQRKQKIRILEGRSSDSREGSVWAQILRKMMGEFDTQRLFELKPRWLTHVATFLPELRNQQGLPESTALSTKQAQQRLFEGLQDFFSHFIAERVPTALLIFLDDLHMADSISLDFLNYLVQHLEAVPMLIVGTCRSEELAAGNPVSEFLKIWERNRLVFRLDLERLAASEVAELLRRLPLKINHLDTFCSLLYSATEGNPLFLLATLQNLFEEGFIRVDNGVWVAEALDVSSRALPTAPKVEDMLKRRIERLAEHEEKVLSLASVIGRDVEVRLLEESWGGQREACRAALVSLSKKQLLIERPDRYEFSHDKLREVAYGRLSDPRRQLLHQHVLHAIERTYAGSLENWGKVLANHAYRAGEWKKAVEYASQAAQVAFKEYRRAESLALIELGLTALLQLQELGADFGKVREYRFELLLGRFQVFRVQGRLREQEQDLKALEELAEQLGDKQKLALVLYRRAELLYINAPLAEAEPVALRALELYRELNDGRGQGNTLQIIGHAYRYTGDCDEALRYYNQALAQLTELKDIDGQAHCLSHIGIAYRLLARYDEALHAHQRVLQIRRAQGDKHLQALSLTNIGNVYRNLGKYQEALQAHSEALDIAKETGGVTSLANITNNLANVYQALGQYRTAMSYHARALELRRNGHDLLGQGVSLHNLANSHWYLGQYQEALRLYQQSLDLAKKTEDKPGIAYNLCNMTNVLLNQGRYSEAIKCSHEALDIFKQVKERTGEAEALNHMGNVYASLGFYHEALRYYHEALTLCTEIKDERGRGFSLRNIGDAYLSLQQFSDAKEHCNEALQISRQTGDQRSHANALCSLGHLFQELEQPSKAVESYQHAASILRKIESQDQLVECLASLGSAFLYCNELAKARDCSSQAIEMLEHGQDCGNAHRVYFTHYKVLSALHQLDDAHKFLQKAYRLVTERAALIQGTELRSSFLNNVKTNHEIIATWLANAR